MIDLLGVIFLAAWTVNVWCIFSVLGSKASLLAKAAWGAILLVPFAGFLGWYVMGPRAVAR